MSKATWNLCPEKGAPHGRDCYWEDDRTFDRIDGSSQEIIDDVPDGLWTIKVRRDYFHKVQGAVRIRDLVEVQARQYTKIWLALESSAASHNYELGILNVRIIRNFVSCCLPTVFRLASYGYQHIAPTDVSIQLHFIAQYACMAKLLVQPCRRRRCWHARLWQT
jgi:hypothetical protein